MNEWMNENIFLLKVFINSRSLFVTVPVSITGTTAAAAL
jgi:hypothetical protein